MAPKIQIPDALKSDLPPNKWGKILGVTPIIMTVIATMLAGLASSEMTKAQYDRAYAAQLQSKAGDQWSYFQAKKLRSASAQNMLDLLLATTDVSSSGVVAIQKNADAATVAALVETKLPAADAATFGDNINAALTALQNSQPESEIDAALAKVSAKDLADALVSAQNAATAFDTAAKPINKAVDKLDVTILNGDDKTAAHYFAAAHLRYTAARYDTEARLNAAIGSLYELQVRQNNVSAEHHHRRSAKFFYGMLAAQMAVIISTFAIAARQRSFLWSIAAAAGAAAIGFAAYVFLYV